MTNEIKEILDLMKFANDDIMWCDTLTLNVKQCHLLLDYITNLQEENKNLKKQYAKEEKKLFHDNEILQQRIDKAVEYIKWNLDKNEELIEYFNYDANFNELLNILRGDE